MTAAPPRVALTRGGMDRWRRGHPWIFRDDVDPRTGGAEARPPGNGEIVAVLSASGSPAGFGFWSERSRIALRMICGPERAPDEAYWTERITEAIALRDRVVSDAEAYRLLAADADGIPGLIADRYGAHLVLQALVPGTDSRLELFAGILSDLLSPESISARNDSAVRTLEGLPRETVTLRGTVPPEVEVREGDVRVLVDLLSGQKTGAFLDQRENRLAAARLCSGRVADLFCYHGSFALHAAARARSVVAVDSSAAALARGRASAALNGIDRIEFTEANVFDFLKACDRQQSRFQAIFLDPPAFAKSRADLSAARRAYKEINLRAMRILEPGGFLITSSCSANLPEEGFVDVLRAAAADARRPVRLIEKRGASRDHPVRLGLPESHYLKCLILQV